jgi:hypothetical protein
LGIDIFEALTHSPDQILITGTSKPLLLLILSVVCGRKVYCPCNLHCLTSMKMPTCTYNMSALSFGVKTKITNRK